MKLKTYLLGSLLLLPVTMIGQSKCPPPIPSLLARHTRNWSRIYVAPLSQTRGIFRVGALASITRHNGYNQQPHFSADGRGLFFSWRPDSSQADIRYYNLTNNEDRPITCTSEEEYSPRLLSGGRAIAVVRVENDSVRRLWRFPLDGGSPSPMFEHVVSVAYYAIAARHTVALYLTDSTAPGGSVLALGDDRTGLFERITTAIGPTIEAVPGSDDVSYVDVSHPRHARLMTLNLNSHHARFITELPEGVSAYTWLPDRSVLVGQATQILRWERGVKGWTKIADLAGSVVGEILRVVADERGDRIAIVVRVE